MMKRLSLVEQFLEQRPVLVAFDRHARQLLKLLDPDRATLALAELDHLIETT
jgi:hypothetical protein